MKFHKSLFSVLIICAAFVYGGNQSHAQDSATLPDEPGLRFKAFSPVPTFVAADPGQVTRSGGVHGKYLLPTAIVVGGTAGLIYADPHVMPYFRDHAKEWDPFTDVFDPTITTAEVIALPASLLTAGYIRHDTREVNTAILAAEAYADSVVINLAIKAVSRRERPSDVPPGGNFEDTFFNGGQSPLHGSSFPSGHSTAVWSVATIVAERYRHRGKPWVPVLCYTMAATISFSRIADSAHFPSDVWLGSSLGYSIAKYQTLRPR